MSVARRLALGLISKESGQSSRQQTRGDDRGIYFIDYKYIIQYVTPMASTAYDKLSLDS